MRRHSRLNEWTCAVGVALAPYAGLVHADAPLPPLPAHADAPLTPVGLLSEPIPDSTPNAAQLRRGQYLVAVGDCLSCHVRPGGEPLAGGLGMETPFGVIYTANISSDPRTGIGSWTDDQFYRAMHDGIGANGEHLYPAFPYASFRIVTREDDDAIIAFLRTTPAVDYTPPKNKLDFPLNFRSVVGAWNLLYLRTGEYQADPKQSADWNRGAYLVNGLGHCGGCHTPLNAAGAEKTSEPFHGARIENWFAPDLSGNERTGLGLWSTTDIVEYLSNGRNARASAGGPMAEVIGNSTSLLNAADLLAVAVYLKSQAPTSVTSRAAPEPGAMLRGAAIYTDVCASCHLQDGIGQPSLFPRLGHDAMVQQTDAIGLEHLILAGARTGTSSRRPSPLAMPSFAWKLTDAQIADVATYIRNSWGNEASGLSASDVEQVRRHLKLETPRFTNNSGDQE